MEQIRQFLKWALYAAVFFLVFAFQSAYAGRLMLLGARPDFLPLLVACVAFLEGAKPGAVFGILAGILYGSVTNLGALYAPVFLIAGYFLGILSEDRVRTNFLTVTAFALGLVLVRLSLQAAAAQILQISIKPLSFLAAYGGCTVFTVAGALPLYPLCKLIHRLTTGAVMRRRMRYRL